MMWILIPFCAFGACAVITVILQLCIGSLSGALDRNPDNAKTAQRLALARKLVVCTAIAAGVFLVLAMIAGALARM